MVKVFSNIKLFIIIAKITITKLTKIMTLILNKAIGKCLERHTSRLESTLYLCYAMLSSLETALPHFF